jgi:hypothetical protein
MVADSRRSAEAESARRLESEQLFELPTREALSYVGAAWADDLVAYANATQTTSGSAGSTSPTSPTVGPVPAGAIDSAVAEAQNSSAQQNGAVAQNVNSPNSSASASTTSP